MTETTSKTVASKAARILNASKSFVKGANPIYIRCHYRKPFLLNVADVVAICASVVNQFEPKKPARLKGQGKLGTPVVRRNLAKPPRGKGFSA